MFAGFAMFTTPAAAVAAAAVERAPAGALVCYDYLATSRFFSAAPLADGRQSLWLYDPTLQLAT